MKNSNFTRVKAERDAALKDAKLWEERAATAMLVIQKLETEISLIHATWRYEKDKFQAETLVTSKLYQKIQNLILALRQLADFTIQLCEDTGVSWHYPSIENALSIIREFDIETRDNVAEQKHERS